MIPGFAKIVTLNVKDVLLNKFVLVVMKTFFKQFNLEICLINANVI
jgi:hypothetical protein